MNDWIQTPSTILCCLCGTPIPANPSNMCVDCIRSQVDISDGIPKQLMIQWCRTCGRYLNPPNQWVIADLESKELLSLCIKRMKGLNKVKLVDAGFIWTEPHSRRLKVKVTIQKEVFTGTILQQVFLVEFVIQNQICENCQRHNAKDTWNAIVQVRQKVDHKRTFYWLEQVILKHNAHLSCINVKERPDGIDFYYSQKNHAIKFIEFLQALVPLRYQQSERLISHDIHSNTYNYKYSFSVELIPVCKDDLVCLPTKLAASCGNISPLVIVTKVSTLLHVMDPTTLQSATITPQAYWGNPFKALCSYKQLIEYTILDTNSLGISNGKFVLAEVQAARTSDFGKNDTQFYSKTFLGHLLKPGDTSLGYDLSTANFNDSDLKNLKGRDLPYLILVRKSFPERRKRGTRRHWKLKQLDKETDLENKKKDSEKEQADYERFMRDIEEDPELRSQINLYKEKNAEELLKVHQEKDEEELENFDEIGIEELIDEMKIDEDDEEDEE